MFLVAMHHGLHLAPDELPPIEGPDMVPAVLRGMKKLGLQGRILRGCDWDKAGALGTAYPAMAIRRDGSWVILVHVIATGDGTRRAAIVDPANERQGMQLWSREDFMAEFAGSLVLCKRIYAMADEAQPFGLRCFLPEIIRQRRFFRGVAIAALLSSLIGFATPLMFQVMIDKVVTHQSWQTLYVVAGAFVLLAG